MFRNRDDAGRQLVRGLASRSLHDPIVLGIPRGGVVVGAVLAHGLGADFDVILARKLRAPRQPEFAIGAVGEDGSVHIDAGRQELAGADAAYVEAERAHQIAEIERRRALVRGARPVADLAGRSVILVDDGIATGSTMVAAIQIVRTRKPRAIIVAVPVAPPQAIADFSARCEHVVCLHTPASFWAIGQFYDDFTQITDEQMLARLREFGSAESMP